jgi:hypothetical protein
MSKDLFRVVCVALLVCAKTEAQAMDIECRHPQSIGAIAEQIGAVGRFNVVVSLRIKDKTLFTMKNVEPVVALQRLARTCDLTLTRYTVPDSPEIFVLTPPDQPVSAKLLIENSQSVPMDISCRNRLDLAHFCNLLAEMGGFNALLSPAICTWGVPLIRLQQLKPEVILSVLAVMLDLNIEQTHEACGNWTYIIKPRVQPVTPQPESFQ